MFANDIPVAEFRGPFRIPVRVGGSIFFLAFLFLVPFTTPAALAWHAMLFAMLLAAIFCHEMGHAWAAHVQGCRVRQIMIHGGGGHCERDALWRDEEREFVVVMGPLTNLALWALSGLLSDRVPEPAVVYFDIFAGMNLFLFLANMIPIQPLDGGKLLQIAVLRLTDPVTARRFCGFVGLIFVALWIPGMLLCYASLGFMLLFVPSLNLQWRLLRGEMT